MLHQLPRELLLEQVNNGLILMVLGMGVVFLFLTLLVFSTKGLSFLVRKYLPEAAKPISPRMPAAPVGEQNSNKQAEIAAAIAAAVARSRQ